MTPQDELQHIISALTRLIPYFEGQQTRLVSAKVLLESVPRDWPTTDRRI